MCQLVRWTTSHNYRSSLTPLFAQYWQVSSILMLQYAFAPLSKLMCWVLFWMFRLP
ncbi:hypothetical protein GIB67_014489 [Kingdonia uniflora]|uniref:Uncharacterized protein n=1 Tax=Kingdonia uniflora TaxID=39325 RepID=A0A7J7LZ71_9MAGN|nr:hypothetical protein GIB67_014489 [Kingdonia uniflora]